MAFDTTQQSYVRFRQILKERTTPVVVWAGAGLSASAGMPTWLSLRDTLVECADKKAQTQDGEAQRHTKALVQLAMLESSLWVGFEQLHRALGNTTWITAIRNRFENAASAKIPQIYLDFWELGINGFLTLNIDMLASRAFSQFFGGGRALLEFSGLESHHHADILRAGRQFVIHLHGILDADKTWIFTQSDFTRLLRFPRTDRLFKAALHRELFFLLVYRRMIKPLVNIW
jgi:hypothetical protein